MLLILMRHAKSDWSFDLEDHERPLNSRGQQAAKAMGDWLRAQNLQPDQVLCSSATRTRETLAGLDLTAPTRFSDVLYHAAPDTLLEELKSATGQTVLIVGHNPGIALFANGLLAKPVDHRGFRDYPTCATLVARFEINTWQELTLAQGHAEAFMVPRELMS